MTLSLSALRNSPFVRFLRDSLPSRLLARYIFANPVLVIEMRRLMRGNRALFLITAYLLILVTSVLFSLAANVAMSGSQVAAGRQIFDVIYYLEIFSLCLVIPGLAATSLPRERENKTFPFLTTTLLSPGEILSGKLLVSIAYISILLIVALPLHAVVFMTGGVSIADLFVSHVLMELTAIFIASVSIAFTVESKKSVVSMVAIYVLVFIVGSPLGFSASMYFNYAFGRHGYGGYRHRPGGILEEILQQDHWFAILCAIAVPVLVFSLLLLALGRERLAGWRRRSSLFRWCLLLFPFTMPWYFPWLDANYRSSRGEELGIFIIMATVFLGGTSFLVSVRGPHRSQLQGSLFEYTLKNLSPRKIFKDDIATWPFFVTAAVAFLGLALPALIAPVVLDPGKWNNYQRPGEQYPELAFQLLAFAIMHIFFWSSFGMMLGIWLQPRRLYLIGMVLVIVCFFAVAIDTPFYKFLDRPHQEIGDSLFLSLFIVPAASLVVWLIAAAGWERLRRGKFEPVEEVEIA